MKIILNDKTYIENALIGLTLTDSIDAIAYKASMELVDTQAIHDLAIVKGNKIQVLDKLYQTETEKTIFRGVVWSRKKAFKKHILTYDLKERTAYLEASEDEYMFKKETADARIKKIASDWGIPIGNIPSTGVKLDKKVEKGKLLDLMRKFLKETVKKGGKMYLIRMEDKLNMYELGKNKIIYQLEDICEEIEDTSSLEGAVTSVKVLGKSKDDKHKTPVLGTFKKDTDKYGTLQKLKQDEKIKNKGDAKKAANSMFNSGEELKTFNCAIDINTIRAGDLVRFYEHEYYVIDVTHSIKPHATMTIKAGKLDYIRRKFFDE
ncbi:XkdQ/YqbQ family protein [Peptostreptococcus anaerobius]